MIRELRRKPFAVGATWIRLLLRAEGSLSPGQKDQNDLGEEAANSTSLKATAEDAAPKARSVVSPVDVWRALDGVSRSSEESLTALSRALEGVNPTVVRAASVEDLGSCLQSLAILEKRKQLQNHPELSRHVLRMVMSEILTEKRLKDSDISVLTKILSSAAVLKNDCNPFRHCRDLVLCHVAGLDASQCADLLGSAAQLAPKDLHFLDSVSKRVAQDCMSLTAKQKSLTVWTWGSLGCAFRPYVEDVVSQICRSKEALAELKAQHYSNFLLSLVRLNFGEESEILEVLVTGLLKAMESEATGHQVLSNVIWALGKLKYRNPAHSLTLARAVTQPSILGELSHQGVCRVLTGWAQIELEDREAIEDMAVEVVDAARLSGFGPQELSQICWAFGQLDVRQPSVVEALVTAVSELPKLRKYTPKQLSTILDGCAKMKVQLQEPVNRLIREALSPVKCRPSKTSDIAKILWAVGSLQSDNDEYYRILGKELRKEKRLEDLTSVDVKHALWGFQLGGYSKIPQAYFFKDVIEHWRYSGKLEKLDAADLKSIRQTLYVLPYIEPNHIHYISRELERRERLQQFLEELAI